MSTWTRTSQIAVISTGVVVSGILGMLPEYFFRIISSTPTDMFVAYAFYFDHKRRTDPEFRKALKRESRREAKAAREEAEARGSEQKKAIKAAVDNANDEGFPTSNDEREGYFMNMVGRGESLCKEGARCQFVAATDIK